MQYFYISQYILVLYYIVCNIDNIYNSCFKKLYLVSIQPIFSGNSIYTVLLLELKSQKRKVYNRKS